MPNKINRIHLPFETKEIPYLTIPYFINVSESIIKVTNTEGDTYKPINDKYVLPTDFGLKEVDLNFLIAFTYIPVYKAFEDVFNWNALKIDNRKPLHPSNLIWKSNLKYLKDIEKPGFYVIPRYTKYCIKEDGTIKRRYKAVALGKARQKYENLSPAEADKLMEIVPHRKMEPSLENTYLQVTLHNDAGGTDSTPVHRLLGFVFLDYSSDVVNMTINHKNGLQHDNDIDNLEWISYSKNNVHAKNEGLCKTRMAVVVIDIFDGIATKYISIAQAAIFTKVSAVTIGNVLLEEVPRVLLNRYIFSNYIDSKTVSYGKTVFKINDFELTKNTDCFAKNIVTNKTVICSDYIELASQLKLNSNIVRDSIASFSRYIRKGYIFGLRSEFDQRNRTFTESEIKAHFLKEQRAEERYKHVQIIRSPIKITTLETGQSVTFANFQKASIEFFNKNRGYLKDCFAFRNNPETIEIKGFKVEKLKTGDFNQ